jgi:hypothetical protein
VNPENALFFVVFNGHGLLLKIANCKKVVDTLDNVVRGLKGSEGAIVAPVNDTGEKSISAEIFSTITYSVPDKLKAYIDKQGIDNNYKMDFKKSIDKHFENLSRMVSVSEKGAKRKTLDEATSEYVLEQKRIRFKRICKDIIKDDISLAEIRDFMIAEGRSDLLEKLVND